MRRSHVPVHRARQQLLDPGARGVDPQDRRGPAVLLQAAGDLGGKRGLDDHQRLLQGGVQAPPDGVRGRGVEAAGRQSRGECRLERQAMLSIRNLHAGVDGKETLRGIDLEVAIGQVHAVMGPNGSGKSTLAQVLAGHPAYTVTSGQVDYQGQDLLAMPPEMRARAGVFLAFQYPVEIPGVANAQFLKAAINEVRTHRGLEELDAMEFLELLREKAKII